MRRDPRARRALEARRVRVLKARAAALEEENARLRIEVERLERTIDRMHWGPGWD